MSFVATAVATGQKRYFFFLLVALAFLAGFLAAFFVVGIVITPFLWVE
ncbi:MAG TPA: hypothetical protein VH253_04275 [Phycisphaerae bacterium]|nr:hypothetical protein [Phycisphaerae bacterium]